MHAAAFFWLLLVGIVFIQAGAQSDGNDTKDYFCNDGKGVLEPNKEKLNACLKEKASTDEIVSFITECNPAIPIPLNVENMKQYYCEISVENATQAIRCETERYYKIEDYEYGTTIYGLNSAMMVCLASCCGIENMGLD